MDSATNRESITILQKVILLPVLQIPCTAPAYLKEMSCGSGPDQALMNS